MARQWDHVNLLSGHPIACAAAAAAAAAALYSKLLESITRALSCRSSAFQIVSCIALSLQTRLRDSPLPRRHVHRVKDVEQRDDAQVEPVMQLDCGRNWRVAYGRGEGRERRVFCTTVGRCAVGERRAASSVLEIRNRPRTCLYCCVVAAHVMLSTPRYHRT